MLEYVRIDVSEGIDVNKTNASKQCNICHYWYVLDKRFSFETYACIIGMISWKGYKLLWCCNYFYERKWLQQIRCHEHPDVNKKGGLLYFLSKKYRKIIRTSIIIL